MSRIIKIAAACAVLALAGCSDEVMARRVLEDQGYSDIRTTGFSWWGCGDDDAFKTGFTAKGPTGRPVSGVICSGWWAKGATVRLW